MENLNKTLAAQSSEISNQFFIELTGLKIL